MPAVVFGAVLAAGLACGPFPSPSEPTAVGSIIPGTRPLTDDQAYYDSPAWSPDGRYLAVFRSYRVFGDNVPQSPLPVGPVLIDLVSGAQEALASLPSLAESGAPGPVLWRPGGEGIAFVSFDLSGGEDSPTLVTYNLDSGEIAAVDFCQCGQIGFNAEGTEILVVSPYEEGFELRWFNLATGATTQELSIVRSQPREHRWFYPALSPDEHQLLLDDLDGNVFIYEMGSGQAPVPFLSSAATPAWSPDGSKIVYAALPASGDTYSGQLMIADADGSSPEPLFPDPQPLGMLFPSWSPDGTQIAFLYGTEHSNRVLVAEVPERLRPGRAAATPAADTG